jgi:hypothetical protein
MCKLIQILLSTQMQETIQLSFLPLLNRIALFQWSVGHFLWAFPGSASSTIVIDILCVTMHLFSKTTQDLSTMYFYFFLNSHWECLNPYLYEQSDQCNLDFFFIVLLKVLPETQFQTISIFLGVYFGTDIFISRNWLMWLRRVARTGHQKDSWQRQLQCTGRIIVFREALMLL